MPASPALTHGGTNSKAGSTKAATVISAVPFIRASAEHREPAGIDISRVLTAADQDLGVFDISAYGYLRSIVLLVTASGGAGAAVTNAEDGPFNAIKNIALTEPNGAVLSQWSSGHSLYLVNKWGGYRQSNGADPRSSPVFAAPSATTGNFQFFVRVPLELSARDGLGALPNQNAAATFKLRLSLAAAATIYGGTVPTTLPTVRVQAYIEAWDQPEAATAGMVNAVMPPAVNTTQFWTEQIYNVNAGQQNIRLTRVGNYIRNLIFVYRRTAGSRLNGQADFPALSSLYLDTRALDIIEKNNWINQMFERTGYGAAQGANFPVNDQPGALDNGVFVYDMTHEFDQSLGRENRDLWLPTLGSTRLELQGTFANAGTLTVLANDVSIAGNVFV